MESSDTDYDRLISESIWTYRRFARLLEQRNTGRRQRGESLLGFDPFRGQGRILLHLDPEVGVPQSKLAKVLDVTPQTLSQALHKLLRDGLVCRDADKLDRRVRLIRLTQKGLEEKRRLMCQAKYSGSMFEALDAGELITLNALLEKISVHLENEIVAAGETPWHHHRDAHKGLLDLHGAPQSVQSGRRDPGDDGISQA